MGLRIIRSVAAAVALCAALVLPGASLASTSTATETLTVQSQLTLTGVPASIAYGSGLGGTTLTGPAITANVTSNNGTGYAFTVASNNLTNGTGSSITATARRLLASPRATP